MKVALSVWGERISPVFDTGSSMLVVTLDGAEESGRTTEGLREVFPPRRAARLVELGVDVLICGAISRPLASMIASYGIQVVPFVSGEAEEVLGAWLSGGLRAPSVPPRFQMPGCCGMRRRFRGRGQSGWGKGGRS